MLRSSLITWEDQLRSHPAYIHSAVEASRIFVGVHDNPALLNSQATIGAAFDYLNPLGVLTNDWLHYSSSFRCRKKGKEKG